MNIDYGYFALLFSIPCFLPQVYKLYKTNNSSSFSIMTVILFWLAQLFWIIHGIQKKDKIIIIGCSINIICFTYIIYKIYSNNELKFYSIY